MPTQTFTNSGTFYWPTTVKVVGVECIGAGAAGDTSSGWGGGGGGYAYKSLNRPENGQDAVGYSETECTGSVYFRNNDDVSARNACGSNPGFDYQCNGTTTYSGGSGGAPSNGGVAPFDGGGGGGAAGPNGVGYNGTDGDGSGTGGQGGATSGGDAGAGGQGAYYSTLTAPTNGSYYGGGGGGLANDGSNTTSRGLGAGGRVLVSWTSPYLDFIQQPTNTNANNSITPAITVGAYFSDDNTLDTSFTGNITIAISNNPGGGTLSGTTTVAAVAGIATFSNLSINNAADGYTLIATADTFTSDTSSSFNINSSSGSVNNNFPLFIHGKSNINNNISLYEQGIIKTVASRILYTLGHINTVFAGTLYLNGHIPAFSGISLYEQGMIPSTGYFPIYMNAIDIINSGIPLFCSNQIPTMSGINLYTISVVSSSGNIPLYITNYRIPGQLTLYIGDLGNRIDNAITLYLKNPGADSGMPLSVWGGWYGTNIDSTFNGIPNYGMINLYIDSQGAYKTIPLYLNSATGTLNYSAPLYINSLNSVNSGIPLVMSSTYGNFTGSMKCFSHGF